MYVGVNIAEKCMRGGTRNKASRQARETYMHSIREAGLKQASKQILGVPLLTALIVAEKGIQNDHLLLKK